MTESSRTDAPLSDYERAVCYYALPKVIHPVTFGLIVAYGVCLLETILLLAYGVATDRQAFINWGTGLFAGMVAFGALIFLVRSFLNDVRKRKMLVEAHRFHAASIDAGDLPDPFVDHVLLRLPRRHETAHTQIMDLGGSVVYAVETEKRGRAWKLVPAAPEEEVTIEAVAGGHSFSFEETRPRRIAVRRGDRIVAHLRKRFAFNVSRVEITGNDGSPVCQILDGTIQAGGRSVGRVYELRNTVYLDIEQDALHDGLLGYVVAMA